MPPLRRHAPLLCLLLAIALPMGVAHAQDVDPGTLPPLTTTPQVEPEPAPAPEPEPQPEPEPAPAPDPAATTTTTPARLADTGADPRAIALLGAMVLLGGIGLRLRTLPERF